MRTMRDTRLATAALLGALLFALALTGCTRSQIEGILSGVVDPVIVPAAGVSGEQVVERSFDSDHGRVQLQVPVDNAVYAGAQSAEKATIFIGRKRPANWVDGHYRAFVNEEHQDAFFSALLKDLHAVRDEYDLDESQYVELVTSMAQSLEYRVDTVSLAPKFPIETFTDGYGDCDDKTLLAAAVLARDGYDVALLFFEPEKHVALAIKAPGLEFKDTGYAYVEMTQPSLVGVAPDALAGGEKLESTPAVTQIGDGQLVYRAAAQITYIEKRLKTVRAKVRSLSKQITRDKKKLKSLEARLDAINDEIEDADTREASNAAVKRFNALVIEHNDVLARVNQAVMQHNVHVADDRFAIDNQFARGQVYQRLKTHDR